MICMNALFFCDWWGPKELEKMHIFISNESINFNDQKELDNTQLLDDPSYLMIASYSMIASYLMIPSYLMIKGMWDFLGKLPADLPKIVVEHLFYHSLRCFLSDPGPIIVYSCQ